MRLRQDRRLAFSVALGGGLLLVAYTLGLVFSPTASVQWFQINVVYNLPGLVTLVLALLRMSRTKDRERWGWFSLAFMLFCWQLADWSYPFYDLVLGRDVPSPGFTDAAYYAGYVGFAAAIPLLVMSPRQRHDPRWLLDSAIIIVVAGVLLAVELLRPLGAASEGTRLAIFVALGYPLLDLVLGSMLVLSLYASSGHPSNRVLVLAGAVVLQIVADVAFLWTVAHGGYDNVASYMDLGWLGTYVLLAVFCVLQAEPEQATQRQRQPGLVGIIAPYCAAVLLAGFTMAVALWGSPHPTLVVGTVAAIVLLSIRQTATMFENLRLFRELEEQMRSRSLWLQVQSDLGEAMLIIENGRITSANDAFERISGYSSDQLAALPSALDIVASKEDREALLRWVLERARGDAVPTFQELTICRSDDRLVNLELATMSDADGRLTSRTLVVARDITERKRAEGALRRSEAVMRGTLESTADGIIVVDTARRVIHYNQRFADLWQLSEPILAGKSSQEMLAEVHKRVKNGAEFLERVESLYGTDAETVDEIHLKDGRILERYTRPLLEDDRMTGRVWSFRDVTERERIAAANRQSLLDIADAKGRLEEKTVALAAALVAEQQSARRDPLTGSMNHGAISTALQAAVATSPRQRHAVIMVDVDGLKAINDAFGHLAGDRLLLTVAEALGQQAAEVGRYGGDEFAVLLPGADRPIAEAYVESVLATLERIEMRDEPTDARIPVEVSLGVALFPDDAETVADLVKLADGAMYTAKRSRSRDLEEGAVPLRRRDDVALRLVAEMIPLLTSPGELTEKLNLISRRLADAAGYDGVRVVIFGPRGERNAVTSAIGDTSDASFAAWRDDDEMQREQPLRALLEKTRRPVLVDDVQSDVRFSSSLKTAFIAAHVQSLVVVPMLWRDQVIGSIGAGRKNLAAFTPRDAQLLATIAGQITAIVRMATLVESLQETSDRVHAAQAETVMMLAAAAAEAHDRTTGLHLVSVRRLAQDLATQMGYSEQDAYQLGLAAVLHDIGKVSVPDTVLAGSGPLAADERAVMRQHTIWGQEFLVARQGFALASRVARSHHERWDGGGYPDGLAADDIPEEATIVTVADSFDAMTHDRPYRQGRPTEEAIEEIVANSGRQFNPRVVEALVRLHEAHRVQGGSERAAEAA